MDSSFCFDREKVTPEKIVENYLTSSHSRSFIYKKCTQMWPLRMKVCINASLLPFLIAVDNNKLFCLVLHLAFQTEFQDSDNFLSAIKEQLNKAANEKGYYNYLPIIQSSGYGKTRAILQLITAQPLIYVCLRQADSTGYPPMTPKSSEMLSEIENAESIDDAQKRAQQWLESMIWVFRDMHLEKKSHELLDDEVT
jgi:hypothetical protein